jgi:hypothetical protein
MATSRRGDMMLDADLVLRIRQIWNAARTQAARSVNSAHVAANWLIGQQIVEAEQGGADRAEYGARLLESLSAQLAAEYGSGFSLTALKYMRLFYIGYPELLQIRHAVRDESGSFGSVGALEIANALRSWSASHRQIRTLRRPHSGQKLADNWNRGTAGRWASRG